MALLALRAVQRCMRLASAPGTARLVFLIHFQSKSRLQIVYSIKFNLHSRVDEIHEVADRVNAKIG